MAKKKQAKSKVVAKAATKPAKTKIVKPASRTIIYTGAPGEKLDAPRVKSPAIKPRAKQPVKAGLDAGDFDGVIAAPKGKALLDLEAPINKAVALTRQLEELTALSGELTHELQTLTTRTIPDAMTAAGVQNFTTVNGVKVAIKEFLNGSLPKDAAKRKVALDWLISVDAGSLIRSKVSVELDIGDMEKRSLVHAVLDEVDALYSDQDDVNHMTLQAFARERMANGQPVPLDVLGLFAGRHAKLTMPKGKAMTTAVEPRPTSSRSATKNSKLSKEEEASYAQHVR